MDRELVEQGTKVRILAEDTGREVTGRIVSIGEFDGGGSSGRDGEDGQVTEPGHPIVVKGVDPLPEEFAGKDVRLTIEAASTDDPVLAVPASAIYATADGSTQVIKLAADGTQRR